MNCFLGWGGREGKDGGILTGQRKTLRVMHIFIALTLMMVSCIYIHICQNLSKYTLGVFTVCQLLLNNAIFKKLETM